MRATTSSAYPRGRERVAEPREVGDRRDPLRAPCRCGSRRRGRCPRPTWSGPDERRRCGRRGGPRCRPSPRPRRGRARRGRCRRGRPARRSRGICASVRLRRWGRAARAALLWLATTSPRAGRGRRRTAREVQVGEVGHDAARRRISSSRRRPASVSPRVVAGAARVAVRRVPRDADEAHAALDPARELLRVADRVGALHQVDDPDRAARACRATGRRGSRAGRGPRGGRARSAS